MRCLSMRSSKNGQLGTLEPGPTLWQADAHTRPLEYLSSSNSQVRRRRATADADANVFMLTADDVLPRVVDVVRDGILEPVIVPGPGWARSAAPSVPTTLGYATTPGRLSPREPRARLRAPTNTRRCVTVTSHFRFFDVALRPDFEQRAAHGRRLTLLAEASRPSLPGPAQSRSERLFLDNNDRLSIRRGVQRKSTVTQATVPGETDHRHQVDHQHENDRDRRAGSRTPRRQPPGPGLDAEQVPWDASTPTEP